MPVHDKKNVIDAELENEGDQGEESDDVDNPDEQVDLSDAIAPGSVIALRTPPEESFYLCIKRNRANI